MLRSAQVETNINSNIKETRIPLKGVFGEHRCWGLPQRLFSNDWLHKRFKGLYKERTLESSTKTLRSPKVKGELSRFKLREKVQEKSST